MSDPSRRRPSAWWFVVAAVIFVLGFVPLAFVGTNAVVGLVEYDITEFDNGNSTELRVDGDQVAVYTTYVGAGTVRCLGSGSGVPVGEDPPDATALAGQLDHPTWSVEISTGSTTWHRVAVTPDNWDDGTYAVTCNVASPGAGNPQPTLGYADNPSILGTIVGFLIAIGIAVVATLIAATIALVTGVKRYRAKRAPLPTLAEFPPNPPPAY